MDRSAVDGVRRFTHRFRHRRMRVNGADEFFDCGLETQGDAGLGDQFGCAGTNHVDAQQLVVFFLGDDLHETFRLVCDLRATEDAEWEHTDTHVITALDRFLFGEADAADLGITIRAAGHLVVVDRTS